MRAARRRTKKSKGRRRAATQTHQALQRSGAACRSRLFAAVAPPDRCRASWFLCLVCWRSAKLRRLRPHRAAPAAPQEDRSPPPGLRLPSGTPTGDAKSATATTTATVAPCTSNLARRIQTRRDAERRMQWPTRRPPACLCSSRASYGSLATVAACSTRSATAWARTRPVRPSRCAPSSRNGCARTRTRE